MTRRRADDAFGPQRQRRGAIAVITVKEAAARLGITTGKLEAMVKQGTVKSLTAGWTAVVPTSEVERVTKLRL